MTSIAIRRPRIGRALPSLATQAGAGLAVAALAAALTWFMDARGLPFGLGAVALVCGTAWLASTRHTQFALALFMLYIGLLDGYLKLSTGVAAVTLLRDVLLFAIVIGLLVRAQVNGTRLTAPPLTAWVAGFAVLVLIGLFNPQGGSVLHSLAGVRQHLEFVPLFFLTFAFVRTTRALRVFVTLLLLIAAANGVASWVQFNLSPQQFAKWGPGYEERVLAKGAFAYAGRTFADSAGKSLTRPFGLGSDAGGGGLVGALAIGAILALASLVGRTRYLLLAVAMAIAVIAGIITSQGRGVVVCAVVVLLGYALLTATSRDRTRGLLVLAGLGVAGLIAVQAILGSGDPSKFRYEGLDAAHIVQTTTQARQGQLDAILTSITSYPLGAGLATSGPAVSVSGRTDLSYVVNTESELSFMTVEAGVAAMVLIVAFTVSLFVLAVRRLRDEPDREARTLLAALIAPVAGMLALYYTGPLTATTPTGPYLWAVAGIVAYWLVARPQQRRREAAAAARAA